MNYVIISLIHDLREKSSPTASNSKEVCDLCEGTVRLLGDRQQTPEPATVLSLKLSYIKF